MKKSFKIGSKITIRSDLKCGMNIEFGVNDEMEKLAGMKSKIVDVNDGCYKLEIDNMKFNWNISMFAEFQFILEEHKKWLNEYINGERADLRGADLRGADLRGADLRGADLRYANLRGADLSNANLSNANLRGADLSNANLSNANLYNADLRYANLYNANLYNADLYNADLRGADLKNAKNIFIPIACPEKGSFIGFKKAKSENGNYVIVELLILEDSKRSSATSRKCRCSKAKVLSITSIDESQKYDKAYSNYDRSFVYEVGKIIEITDFEEDRFKECATGIHFFITRQEAVNY